MFQELKTAVMEVSSCSMGSVGKSRFICFLKITDVDKVITDFGLPKVIGGGARLLADHPDQRAELGRRAQGALAPHRGAARRQAALIAQLCAEGS